MLASPSNGDNAGASSTVWLIPLVVVAILIVAGTVTAESSSQDLGEIEWPPEEHQRFQDLADLGASVFANGTEPTRIGTHPVESVHLEAVNDTSTRLVIQEKDRSPRSLLQHHEPVRQEGHRNLQIRPSDLEPTVQTPFAGSSGYVLTLIGPPGTFDLGGADTHQKVQDLAAQLGFPLGEVNPNVQSGNFPALYGQNTCYGAPGDRCSETGTFLIDCPGCQLAGFNGPAGDSALEDRFLIGGGLVLFDKRGRMLAATVDYRFDLNESAVLDDTTARDAAANGLRDRGYEIVSTPDLEQIRVVAQLTPGRVEVQEVRYTWPFGVVREENGTAFDGLATVEQNAATGEIVDIQRTPADASSPPVDGGDGLGEISLGAMAGLVSIGLAALLARRRRSS